MTIDQLQGIKPAQKVLTNDLFDIAIVGAGVVGCAIARRFTLQGARVVVLEKASDILDGASKANSAILHTGFDAPPGSLEWSCIVDGHEEYRQIYHELGLTLEQTGAFVVGWRDEEMAKLEGILQKAHANGITDTALISAPELAAFEPNLSRHALGAINIPRESIIDPWSAPYAYLHQSLLNGGEIFRSCEVLAGQFDVDRWQLQTNRGSLNAKTVINCAGLYGDRLNEALLGGTQFNITPRKGQFVVFDKAASDLINAVILPVPTERTKGVVLFRTVFGNLVVGPTAEDQQSRSDSSTDKAALEGLIAAGIEKLPGLENMPITAVYAGLRPASEYSDYQIEADPTHNWITVGGIRSTGLSGALGIARHVYSLYSAVDHAHTPIEAPKIPQAPMLTEKECRDWQRPDHGDIVCHCELVTKREIDQALQGPLGARSLPGLKRQTRVTMGRCQGFYCSARLSELTDDHFDQPLLNADASIESDHD